MNSILKNEEFLEKLEEKILDKLADKVVESITSDKDFAPYLGHEEPTIKESEVPKLPREKAGVERFLQHKLSTSAEEISEKLRSLSPLDKLPGSVSSINIERSWEGFVEKEKSAKKKDVAPSQNDLEQESKVTEKMNSFEDKIVKIIERGGLEGITSLTEFYTTVDDILRRTEKVDSSWPWAPAVATPKERDSLHSTIKDARALSAFNSLSEAAAGELLLSRIRNGKFSLLQDKEGFTTTSRLVFDEGEATLVEYYNTTTAHRYIKVTNFFLFEKVISDFQFSSDKAMEVWEILENRKNITILEHQKLNSEFESKRLNPKEIMEEVCEKNQVAFMSPEFLQAVQ
jgi:hypothetical protein